MKRQVNKKFTRSVIQVSLLLLISVIALFNYFIDLTDLFFVVVVSLLYLYDRSRVSKGTWKNGNYKLNNSYVRRQVYNKVHSAKE